MKAYERQYLSTHYPYLFSPRQGHGMKDNILDLKNSQILLCHHCMCVADVCGVATKDSKVTLKKYFIFRVFRENDQFEVTIVQLFFFFFSIYVSF